MLHLRKNFLFLRRILKRRLLKKIKRRIILLICDKNLLISDKNLLISLIIFAFCILLVFNG